MARRRKTPEELADERRRYELARSAVTDAELEQLLADPNQSIRSVAAMNPHASAVVLDQFAADAFWGTRVEVARHANASRPTLLRLLEADPKKRGVVHHAVRERLAQEGVRFGDDGMPE